MADQFFYQHKIPEIDELVMVSITNIDDIGAICSLLEYNNIEGFIYLSELNQKRIRSVLKHIRIGQKHVFRVINIDNNYINLSKKYIDESEKVKGTEKYKHGKAVHRIVKHLAETKHQNIDYIYEIMIWPLYKTYTDPYEAFKLIADNTNIYDDDNIPSDYIETIHKIIKQQFAVQPVKVGVEFDITSFVGGINDIKHALRTALMTSSKSYDIKIQLVSSPTFLVYTMTINHDDAIKAIKDVTNTVKDEITKLGGNFVCEKTPYIMSKHDI